MAMALDLTNKKTKRLEDWPKFLSALLGAVSGKRRCHGPIAGLNWEQRVIWHEGEERKKKLRLGPTKVLALAHY